MKHLKKNRKFGRAADFRKAFIWNLGNSLVLKEKIKTTEARAKEIKSLIEPIVTKAKKDTLANRRLLLKRFNQRAVGKLFKEIGPRFEGRSGGYLRISKFGLRKNDGAKMAIIEFVK